MTNRPKLLTPREATRIVRGVALGHVEEEGIAGNSKWATQNDDGYPYTEDERAIMREACRRFIWRAGGMPMTKQRKRELTDLVLRRCAWETRHNGILLHLLIGDDDHVYGPYATRGIGIAVAKRVLKSKGLLS